MKDEVRDVFRLGWLFTFPANITWIFCKEFSLAVYATA